LDQGRLTQIKVTCEEEAAAREYRKNLEENNISYGKDGLEFSYFAGYAAVAYSEMGEPFPYQRIVIPGATSRF
jgi:hypothetical protein